LGRVPCCDSVESRKPKGIERASYFVDVVITRAWMMAWSLGAGALSKVGVEYGDLVGPCKAKLSL
jgi:hypothetical protein